MCKTININCLETNLQKLNSSLIAKLVILKRRNGESYYLNSPQFSRKEKQMFVYSASLQDKYNISSLGIEADDELWYNGKQEYLFDAIPKKHGNSFVRTTV